MNSLCEIKISVFKKCDYGGLADYANNDSMDRYHVLIYSVATLLQTSQDSWVVARQALVLYLVKAFVDHVKHFYLTNLNRLNIDIYSGLRHDMFRKLY